MFGKAALKPGKRAPRTVGLFSTNANKASENSTLSISSSQSQIFSQKARSSIPIVNNRKPFSTQRDRKAHSTVYSASPIVIMRLHYAGIAQLVEQLTCNQ